MKKRGRRARLPPDVPACQRNQTQSVAGVKKPTGRHRRHNNAAKTTPPSIGFEGDFEDVGANDRSARLQLSTTVSIETEEEEHPEDRLKKSGMRRLCTAFCRLCHGKFSPRRLRHAFDKCPVSSDGLPDPESAQSAQSPLLFYTDFQRLVGVPLNRDPRLSQFVCKNCHTKFYKCHTILLTFLQRVNLLPSVNVHTRDRKGKECSQDTLDPSLLSPSISSDPKGLHSLVSWAHHHAEDCRSCPDLKEVVEGQCWGSVRAIWACVDGHRYVMDTQKIPTKPNPGHAGGDPLAEGEQQPVGKRTPDNNSVAQPSPAAAPQTQSCIHTDASTTSATESLFAEETPSPASAPLMDGTGDGDLSDRNLSSEDDLDDRRKRGSSDELFEPYPEKVASPKKRTRRKEAKTPEDPQVPKVRKKPGPKPGWKIPIKSEREELPNIYKCPHQGCSAVYRGADGMKKHIKEHHEEVRERPCPHPGCNKVFMIDRYLQRHVKLIHTEVRNYICDQCGQTFKQRKHLSVHQMRHSGAKPLQCEVCGFQCRQRASLKYHMTKHQSEADLEFECRLCGKRFEKAHNLNVHMSMVHPLTQAASGEIVDSPPDMQNATDTGELHPYTS
ncbi:hypothetical protein DPEC_G00215540 [Dallia pectoralis]|uniref:Uncharacterized protein n=1 Tax=Dallia pectoralis TaxID=75939 RepID=A0ACC2G2A4_DALPE|nr:hypothetical protein DPEC_G00215540 [Dallia pectoralis]